MTKTERQPIKSSRSHKSRRTRTIGGRKFLDCHPDRTRPGDCIHRASPKDIRGVPTDQMAASFAWSGPSVTVTFPPSDFYPDDTGQTWTWNDASTSESAALRTKTYSTSNALNKLRVAQIRPGGPVKFEATGIVRPNNNSTVNLMLSIVP